MDVEERTPAFVPDQAAIIHFYRGELGRKVAYRVRLDTTTNWAIGLNAAVLSLAFTNRNPPHVVFAIALLLTLAFMWIEARRYRTFDLIRWRIRLIETGFYNQVLGGEPVPRDWARRLRANLLQPRPPISRVGAVAVRLRRVYLWIVLVVYIAWAFHLATGESWSKRAEMGGISGAIILIASAVILIAILGLAFIPRTEKEEEG